ncbi:MAG TPA: PfkB family carbohydrate kinase [Spirochaetia bacterium]|nr:PfkB family carbohydrate kinase [Spirochaetia bacterium]
MPKFLCVCLNPTLQRTFVLSALRENEVNRTSEYYLDAAGKGVNAARILSQLGSRAIHLTHAGGRNRELLIELASSSGVDIHAVESGSEIRTCYTLLSAAEQTTTEIVEESEPVGEGTEVRAWEKYLELVEDCDVLVIGGTKSIGLSDTLYPRMTQDAKGRGKRVVLDIRGRDLLNSLAHGPDVIKPNLAEFVSTFLPSGEHTSEHTRDPKLIEAVTGKMREIYATYGTVTVLTRGGNETLYVEDAQIGSAKPGRIEPVNTIGCGDAFTAGFARSWAEGASIAAAVAEGNRVAGLNARQVRPGTIR